MRTSIASLSIAGVLVTTVVIGTGMAYGGRNVGSCDPTCFDVRIIGAFISLGLFGALVSLSIGQLAKPRSRVLKWAVRFGSAIFLAASLAFFFFSLSPVALIFIAVALITVGRILEIRKLASS